MGRECRGGPEVAGAARGCEAAGCAGRPGRPRRPEVPGRLRNGGDRGLLHADGAGPGSRARRRTCGTREARGADTAAQFTGAAERPAHLGQRCRPGGRGRLGGGARPRRGRRRKRRRGRRCGAWDLQAACGDRRFVSRPCQPRRCPAGHGRRSTRGVPAHAKSPGGGGVRRPTGRAPCAGIARIRCWGRLPVFRPSGLSARPSTSAPAEAAALRRESATPVKLPRSSRRPTHRITPQLVTNTLKGTNFPSGAAGGAVGAERHYRGGATAGRLRPHRARRGRRRGGMAPGGRGTPGDMAGIELMSAAFDDHARSRGGTHWRGTTCRCCPGPVSRTTRRSSCCSARTRTPRRAPSCTGWSSASTRTAAGRRRESVPPGGTALVNGFGQRRWDGPHPPPGDEAHRYFFRLYALGSRACCPTPRRRSRCTRPWSPWQLASGTLVGVYRRCLVPEPPEPGRFRDEAAGHRTLPHPGDVRIEAWGETREQCLGRPCWAGSTASPTCPRRTRARCGGCGCRRRATRTSWRRS